MNIYPIDIYTANGYILFMIKSFADRETEMIFHQRFSKHFPHEIQRVALRKLIMLNRAKGLDDLCVPPGNRLEALSGNREGQYSIRINDQFRICFKTDGKDFYLVEVVDYH